MQKPISFLQQEIPLVKGSDYTPKVSLINSLLC